MRLNSEAVKISADFHQIAAILVAAILNMSNCPRVPGWHQRDFENIGINETETSEKR